jgi:hypothetical protein
MTDPRQLTESEVEALASQSAHPAVEGMLMDMAKELDDYGPAVVYDGDCAIEGDFDTGDQELAVLIVRGDLIVSGTFRDRSDDGPTVTVVLGDLRAKNVITAGILEVTGDMVVHEAIVGDYNDGSALIHGSLRTDLLMPVDIAYEVRGELTAEEQIPGFTTKLTFVPKRLHPRFFVEGDGGAELFAGEASDRFVQAIMAGESILV